jgi:membrane-associated phospholipid phosphatase
LYTKLPTPRFVPRSGATDILAGSMRGSSAIRAAAWGAVVVGAAAPLVRRRLRLPPPVVTTAAAAAPVALAVAVRRSHLRDVGVVCLQMNAYVATYEMPHDDPERLRARVRVRYPVVGDRLLGLGELPGLRLQRAFARPEGQPLRSAEQVLVWCHWLWFAVPHGTVAYLLAFRRELFPRGAAQIYAVFDLGLIGYWALPTAPPWYAAQVGALGPSTPMLRRMMREHGEAFWKGAWTPLYDVLGGNPLAAMPSLHFATSVMAAHLLTEAGPVQGALGWTYALTLGFALVYLGEHYVVDLLAGLALAEGVRRSRHRAAPALRGVSRTVQRLEARARR